MKKPKEEYENKIKQLLDNECDTNKTLADLEVKKDKFAFGGLFGSLTFLASITGLIISTILVPGEISSLVLFGICALAGGIAALNTLPQYFKCKKILKKARKMIKEYNNELEQLKLDRKLNKDNQINKNLTKNVVQNNEVEKNENKSNKTI